MFWFIVGLVPARLVNYLRGKQDSAATEEDWLNEPNPDTALSADVSAIGGADAWTSLARARDRIHLEAVMAIAREIAGMQSEK